MNKRADIQISIAKPYGTLMLQNCEILPSRGRSIVLAKWSADYINGRQENGNGSQLGERRNISANELKLALVSSGISFHYTDGVFALHLPIDTVNSVMWR